MSVLSLSRLVLNHCHQVKRAWNMRIIGAVLLSAIASVMMTAQAAPQASQAGGIADSSLDARVESILQQMTLEEKVGQLVQYSAGQPTGPGTGGLIMRT